jgi:hypothetical protein
MAPNLEEFLKINLVSYIKCGCESAKGVSSYKLEN